MKSARELSFETLLKIEKDNSYSNLSIAGVLKDNNLEDADKAFFTALVYGVVERKITLDYNIGLYLKQPIKKLKTEALIILRIGAYQLLFMDKIPSHAAINESVNLAKKKVNFASGLINAVLRKIDQNGLQIPEDNLEVKYSCPQELIDLFIDAYGKEKAIGILEHANGPQKMYARDKEKGLVELTELKINNNQHIQDKASQLCCEAIGAQPGETIFDMCAAPGGKSFTIAEIMQNKGRIVAFDLYPQRVELIAQGAKRLGIDIIDARVGDASQFDENLGLADRVLCDVPCAGLGDIGRKPEIRYKSIKDIEKLPPLQYNILVNSARYLKVYGTLVYSTCSLNPKENEEVVKRFLDAHDDFELVEQRTIFPQEEDCDGFFYSVMKKNETRH
ncbi:MAG: 16S rRNA (cytosine(967)-C(5))-methyltransferase RsmB [Oscillospiraceae bacterium]|nr:16S rRNA (cytosine(967)-C(5))-methyltransferase RsmB [Candidatus Limimonas egerieequi]